MIVLENVHKSYGRTPVLRNCNATVRLGEVVVVCGPSGSGKSTLIKCINGLVPIDQGTITVDGVTVTDKSTDLPALRTRIGMLYDRQATMPMPICVSTERSRLLGRTSGATSRSSA